MILAGLKKCRGHVMAQAKKNPIDSIPMEVKISALLGWVLPVSLGIAVFGIFPTWLKTGWAGVWAELAAGAVVLSVMLGNGLVVVAAAKKDRASAAMAFSASSLVRMVLCPLLTALVWWLFDLAVMPLGVWMVIFYLTGLAMECVWIVRALRKHSRLYGPVDDEEKKEPAGLGQNSPVVGRLIDNIKNIKKIKK